MQSPKALTLSAHGAKMPAIGYGTMELPQRPAEVVAYAIRCGYRLIDTARKYGTEERVGEGIRASGVAREELWVTTKVTELDAREADFLRSAENSLKALQLDYVDLLLVHWPQPKVPFAETLGALAKAKRRGLTRHIGVSNFTLAMIEEAVQVCPEPLIIWPRSRSANASPCRSTGAASTCSTATDGALPAPNNYRMQTEGRGAHGIP
jgi:diketogulonate reductase-like aldo/keto reductase